MLERVAGEPMIVIDGLRFLEDRAFFVEQFGANFLHLHIVAPREIRRQRFLGQDGSSFDETVAQPVEREVGQLEAFATVKVDNSTTIDRLTALIADQAQALLRKIGAECQFRSS